MTPKRCGLLLVAVLLAVCTPALAADEPVPAAGHVFVKSGTRAQGAPTGQGILSALTQAGYIDAHSGRKLVYALFLRDLSLSPDFKQFYEADDDQGVIAAAFQEGF